MEYSSAPVNINFYTPEFSVCYYQMRVSSRSVIHQRKNNSGYEIFYVQKGNFTALFSGKSVKLSPGDVLVARSNEDFQIFGIPFDEKAELHNPLYSVLAINFHQRFFEDVKGDKDFLRVFNNRDKYQNNIYKKSDFGELNIEESIIKTLKKYSDYQLGMVHYATVVSMLITWLDLCFDNKFKVESTNSSDEYDLKIWDYICANFCSPDISIKKICEKFSVSKWYVNKTTKRFYNASFQKTIDTMRMWYAKWQIQNRYITDLTKLSYLCGYIDYSGFYRCYKKIFGISPKEDLTYFKRNGLFLSNVNLYNENKGK